MVKVEEEEDLGSTRDLISQTMYKEKRYTANSGLIIFRMELGRWRRGVGGGGGGGGRINNQKNKFLHKENIK